MINFKNDKERIAFLEDDRNGNNGWYLWGDNQELGRRWWRYDLPDCAFVVEEEKHTPIENVNEFFKALDDWNKL